MNRPYCLIAVLACALVRVGVVACGAAEATPAQANGDDLAKLLAAVQPKWTSTANASVGTGYKDNLLLSHADPEKSAFLRGGVETLWWHVPRGRVDYFGFLNAEGRRYFSGHTVHHEEQAFAGLEWRYRIEDVFTFSLDGQGYYLDQIFDVSDTDVTRVIAELKVAGAKVGPTLRWTIRPWIWLEGRGNATRESFRDGLNNASIVEGTGRVGIKPTARLEVTIEGNQRRRRFDRRTQFSASGLPLSALLAVQEREVVGEAALTWGAGRHWKTTPRIGRLWYEDNGAGYLNFRRDRVGLDVEWAAGRWLVRTEGEARRREYELQTVGRGVSPPQQIKDEFTATLHVERKLSERWTIFGEYSWERSRSNEVIESYRVNEGLLGVRWSWEK